MVFVDKLKYPWCKEIEKCGAIYLPQNSGAMGAFKYQKQLRTYLFNLAVYVYKYLFSFNFHFSDLYIITGLEQSVIEFGLLNEVCRRM